MSSTTHHPTARSFFQPHTFLLLMGCGLLHPVAAQQLQKAEFGTGPERAATDGPRKKLHSTTSCTFVLDLSVTRAGQVAAATVNAPLTTCTDSAMLAEAAALARTYVFSPAADAPEPQPVRLFFRIGDPTIDVMELPEDVALPEPVAEENERTYTSVQVPPQFPGGQAAMDKYLERALHQPATEAKAKGNAQVIIGLVVTADGSFEDIVVLKGMDAELDAEALRVVRTMPRWIPGRQNDVPVRVRWQVPITFRTR